MILRQSILLALTIFLLSETPIWPSEIETTASTNQLDAKQASVEINNWLVIERTGRAGRRALHTDEIEFAIVKGVWKTPAPGDIVTLPDETTQTWTQANTNGKPLEHDALRGGYALAIVNAQTDRCMILEASGHSLVYVNGEPRTGDPYGTGWVKIPINLRKGQNTLLFSVRRGRLEAKLNRPLRDAMFGGRDLTIPTLVIGQPFSHWSAIPVINASGRQMDHLKIVATTPDGQKTVTDLPTIQPYSVRKAGFQIQGTAGKEAENLEISLALLNGDVSDTTAITLPVRDATSLHQHTFKSDIDDSVQYYAVRPMKPGNKRSNGNIQPAMFLTLHGASVEAAGQAAAYQSKEWGHVVAPTNRRPFGFDWEDWGRRDAIEVLNLAGERLGTDPSRTYLTGHSMGGHGTWQVGATYPDRFAAIAPGAGWISFWSYSGGSRISYESPVGKLLDRATSSSDTLALAQNYAQHGVYILHGDRDDNVPVAQARQMREHLSTWHRDFAYFEQPGAGHWWGNQCVDWPQIFEFFAHRNIKANHDQTNFTFTTANPAISSRCHWLRIVQQQASLEFSKVEARVDTTSGTLNLATTNVAALSIDPVIVDIADPTDYTISIDDQILTANSPTVHLKRDGHDWITVAEQSSSEKGPHRGGPFKLAFDRRFVLVYGTTGSVDENAWSFAKARYDAEVFMYRGNGSVGVIADTEFSLLGYPDRSVILYGNRTTNAAWSVLLADSPVQIESGRIHAGDRTVEGDSLATLFLRPRGDSDTALVGVVSGTGIAGMRSTDRMPYFVSGVAYPDFMILDSNALRDEIDGVIATGYFGNDWSIESGEFAWSHE